MHTHKRKEEKKKYIYLGPSSLCRFPLLGFSLIQPFGLFAVFANFLLSQKQIEMSLELMYTRTSLTSWSNIFHMCANLAGRRLPRSHDIRCLGNVLECLNLSRMKSLSLFLLPFHKRGHFLGVSFPLRRSPILSLLGHVGCQHFLSGPLKSLCLQP